MKVSYQREMKRNYMIIDPEDLAWDGYECHMMAVNEIDGLLNLRVCPVEDGVRFYYDITSRQPLSRLLNGARFKAPEFRSLITQIYDILSRMDDYLLNESRIWLDPSYIYMEPESGKLYLCLVPGMERSFADDLGTLLETLLESVDHRDRECVVLAYGIYQETRKENYGMDDIMRRIYREEKADLPADVPVKETENAGVRQTGTEAEAPEEEAGPDRAGLWERLKGTIQHFFSERQEEEEEAAEEFWPETEGEEENEWKKLRETTVYQTSEKEEEVPLGDTMILSDLGACMGMRKLRALDPGACDIPISYYPFVIGKQANLVDYRINDDTVSRLHLRIDRKEDRYLIEDLNSTNGTTLRGKLLANNAQEEIKPGDEISIARYRFRFE